MNFLLLFWVGVSKLWSKFHVNVCFPNCIAVLVAGPFVLWWDLTPLLCILSIFLWLKLAIIHYSIFCSLLFHRFFVFFFMGYSILFCICIYISIYVILYLWFCCLQVRMSMLVSYNYFFRFNLFVLYSIFF